MSPGPGTARARARPQAAGAGFTLIEVMVVLTLLGLMFLLLFGAFRLGARAWETGDRRMAELGEIEAAQDLLRSQLAQAVPLMLERPASEPQPVFAGSAEELRFAAPLPTHSGAGGYYVFRLAATGPSDRRDVRLAWRLFRPDGPAEPDEEDDSVVLVRGVDEVALSYFGRPQDREEGEWRDGWDGEDGLPQLVRVVVTLPGGDARRWPPLVVAPKALGAELEQP